MNIIILNFLLAPGMLREQILSCKSAIRKITGVDLNIGDIRTRDLGLKFHLKDRKSVGSNLDP